MSSLFYLSIKKLKGRIRNQFRSLTAGLITLLLILLYGGFFLMALVMSRNAELQMLDMDKAVLCGLGLTALLAFSAMLNKRKALFSDTDVHYLFTGPYKKGQINGYLLFQIAEQSVSFGFLSCYITVVLAMGNRVSLGFFLCCFLVYGLCFFFFLLLTDYLYMWGLADKKYKKWMYLPPAGILLWALAVFLFSMRENGYALRGGAVAFAQGQAFYSVPFFGWGKWILSAMLRGDYLEMLPGTGLFLLCIGVLLRLFLAFDKEIGEAAAADAESVSAYIRKARSQGGQGSLTESRRAGKIKGEFSWGARAVFSKNMLLMRKSGGFLRKQDVFLILFYFVISYLVSKDRAFFMFCYMLAIWMFTMLNDSELLRDLKNYQIYLIPDSPIKKLAWTVIPAYFRVGLSLTAALFLAGLITRMPFLQILQYILTYLGYGMVFVAGTVVSVRTLGSRSNAYLEAFFRMLIIVAAAIPSGLAAGGLWLFLSGIGRAELFLGVVSGVSLTMNFLVSIGLILACKGMMEGGEL